MQYQNLHELVAHSRSSRNYFLSLPVELQIQLSEHSAYIRTAAQLRLRAEHMRAYNRLLALSDHQN